MWYVLFSLHNSFKFFTPVSSSISLSAAISIGSSSPQKADSMYVTPVPIRSETTNNALIDDLVKSLYTQYDKMFAAALRPGQEKYEKDEELNRFMLAIRALHVKLDFEPIAAAAQNYINVVSEVLDELQDIDSTNIWRKIIDMENEIKNLDSQVSTLCRFIDHLIESDTHHELKLTKLIDCQKQNHK